MARHWSIAVFGVERPVHRTVFFQGFRLAAPTNLLVLLFMTYREADSTTLGTCAVQPSFRCVWDSAWADAGCGTHHPPGLSPRVEVATQKGSHLLLCQVWTCSYLTSVHTSRIVGWPPFLQSTNRPQTSNCARRQ